MIGRLTGDGDMEKAWDGLEKTWWPVRHGGERWWFLTGMVGWMMHIKIENKKKWLSSVQLQIRHFQDTMRYLSQSIQIAKVNVTRYCWRLGGSCALQDSKRLTFFNVPFFFLNQDHSLYLLPRRSQRRKDFGTSQLGAMAFLISSGDPKSIRSHCCKLSGWHLLIKDHHPARDHKKQARGKVHLLSNKASYPCSYSFWLKWKHLPWLAFIFPWRTIFCRKTSVVIFSA